MNQGYSPSAASTRRTTFTLSVEKEIADKWVRTALAPDLEAAAKHARSVGGRVQALTRDGDFVAEWQDGVLTERAS